MKKIINGAKYDTKTAKQLGYWSYGYANDFSYIQEALYRTKSGKYFLHGYGGPMTKYKEYSSDNSWGWGEQIIPMSRAEAQEWAEERLDGEEYEEIFGEVADDDGKEQLKIVLSESAKAKVWRLAEDQGVSASQLIEDLIQKM